MNVVLQLRNHDLIHDVIAQVFLQERRQHFDTTVQVTRHQVGTAEVHLFIPVIVEIVDAGMLENPVIHDMVAALVFKVAELDGVKAELDNAADSITSGANELYDSKNVVLGFATEDGLNVFGENIKQIGRAHV